MLDKEVVDLIRSGIERDDRYTPEEIVAGILSGEFQLFGYPKGIVITQVTSHNRVLVFLVSGRDLDEWKEKATEDLRRFADGRIVEAYCRPGLEKILKDIGWVKKQVVLRLTTKTKGAQCQGISSAQKLTP